jgi:hypothetical protein
MTADGGYLAQVLRAETELRASRDTHQVIGDRLGMSPDVVQMYCNHLVKRGILGRCAHVQHGDGTSWQQPPWHPRGQQTPDQWLGQAYHGQPAYPPQAYGQQPYGQQHYEQQQPCPGQPHYQGQPYWQSYQQGQPHGGQPWSSPGPQGPPRWRSWPRQHKMLTVLAAVTGLLVVTAIAIAAGGNHQASPAAASSPLAASPAAPAAFSPPDCHAQATAWANGGGASQLSAVAADMGNLHEASLAIVSDMNAGNDTSADQAAIQTAAASLQSDSQTAEADPPPTCIPRMRADEDAALNDASKAAINCQNGVSEFGSGNDSVAVGDFDAAASDITASGNAFQAATADLNAWESGQS